MAEGAPIDHTASSPIGWLSWRCSIYGLPFTGADSAALDLAPFKLGHPCQPQLNSAPPGRRERRGEIDPSLRFFTARWERARSFFGFGGFRSQASFALILEPIAFAIDGDDRVLAYRPELGSAKAVAVGHHDEQGITLGEAAVSPASGCDHAFDFVRRQVLAGPAGLVRLASGRHILAFLALCLK
jgi:hypothetical protein